MQTGRTPHVCAAKPLTAAKERHCEENPDDYVSTMTSLVEIQSAILQLKPAEREELRHWFDETAEETPEMLAAIDEGLRSLKEKGIIPLDEVRKNIPRWATKSA